MLRKMLRNNKESAFGRKSHETYINEKLKLVKLMLKKTPNEFIRRFAAQ